MGSDDAAEFLSGTPDRRRLMTALTEDPASPAELAESLDLPRRSVQRHLRDLVDRAWADKANGRYELTVTGTLIIERHAAYLDELDHIESFGSFFQHLPDRTHAPEPRWLTDATHTTASVENPQAPVEFYIDRVREFDTNRIQMISPVLSRLFHKAHAKLAMDGLHTDLILSATTIERARELNPTEFKVVASVDVLDLYEYPEDITFGLTVGDDRLLMSAYDRDGQMKACVESLDPDFIDWASQLFYQYEDGSSKIVPPMSLPFSLRD